MENKLLEALKGIAQCCDSNNGTHEQIWHIAFAAINEHEKEVKSTLSHKLNR